MSNPETVILNLAHPLTPDHLAQMTAILGHTPAVRFIATQTDRSRPLVEVAHEIIETVGLTSEEWQTLPLILNPPGLAPLALAVTAELHGRCGYFLPIMHMRPLPDALPPRYEVAEIVNLQAARERARSYR
jgi:hypothetical protein